MKDGLLKIINYYAEGKEGEMPISGGMNTNPTWDEYVDGYKEEYKQHLQLIKKAIEENGWIGITGEDQQNLKIAFRFSDDSYWSFTWRAWGDLMQAIVNKREGYMAYYM